MIKLYIIFFLVFSIVYEAAGQKLTVPRLVPDGEVTKLDYNPDLGLLLSGTFEYVGFPARNMGIVNNSDGNPTGILPYQNSNGSDNLYRQDVIPDGANGWYVLLRSGYGQTFQYRPQHILWDSTNTTRIIDHVVHILPNNSIDTVFKIEPTPNYRISGIHNLVLYKSVLYGWCDLTDSQGNITSRKLLGIDAQTGKIVWDPNTLHRTDRYTGGIVVAGRNLFTVGSIINVNGQPSIRNSVSYNLDSRTVRTWNPFTGYNFSSCTNCEPVKISTNNRLLFINIHLPNANCTNLDIVASDTITGNRVWSKSYSCVQTSTIQANDSVAYAVFNYTGMVSNHHIRKFRVSDGTLLQEIPYPTGLDATALDNPIYVGPGAEIKLYGKYLYLYSANGSQTMRRGILQIDITDFHITDWKPMGEREAIDIRRSGSSFSSLSEQNGKVFIAGIFQVLKPKYVNGLAIINPYNNSLLFRPALTENQAYIRNPSAVSFDGDSLVWIVNNNRFRGFDTKTGLLIYNFDASGPYAPVVNQLITGTDKLYLRGYFSGIQGQPASPPGFGVINREGAPFAWPTTFPVNSGQTANIQITGDKLWVGGSFTTDDGKSGLALLDKNTGQPTSWTSVLTARESVNNFLVTDRDIFVDRYSGATRFALLNKDGTLQRELSNSLLECSNIKNIVSKEKYIFLKSDCYTSKYDPVFTYYDREYKKFYNGSILKGYSFTINSTAVYAPAPKTNAEVFVGDKLYHGTQLSTYSNPNTGSGVIPVPPLTFTEFQQGFFNSKIEYFPHAGNTAAFTTVNFYGYVIAPGSKIRLLLGGQAPITVPDSLVSFPEQFRMQVVFNLRGKTTGEWDIEITLPNGEVIIISKGFKINSAKADDIRASIVAPSATRVGAPTPILISVANRGDADVFNVPVWIISSPDAILTIPVIKRINDSTFIPSLKPGILPIRPRGGSGSGSGGGGGSSNNNGSWVTIPVIPAGKTHNIPVTVTPKTQTPVTVQAYPGAPLMRPNSEINPSDYDTYGLVPYVVNCAADAFKQAVKSFVGTAATTGLIESAKLAGVFYKAYDTGINIGTGNFRDVVYDVGGAALDITNESAPHGGIKDLGESVSKAFGALDAFGDVNGVLTVPNTDGCNDLAPLLKQPTPRQPNTMDMPVVNIRAFGGIDPNDKLGPVGVKAERYVNNESLFSYLIRFENKNTATADVQYIRVVDTLDRAKYDFSTFQLGYFNLADTNLFVPPGKKHHIVDWDLRPSKNLVLRMEATFDETSGILSATYTGLDPKTMEQTSEILLGFLPPNQIPPKGEGGLAYSVQLKENLADRTTVSNKAAIYFDYNAPIPTPVWTNTVDKVAPASQIVSLPTVSTDTIITLRWSGGDSESGVRLYNIYSSVNGGAYQMLLSSSSDTASYRFVGRVDSTYSFYSIAVDSVGNRETTPSSYDTQTTIRFGNLIETVSNGNWNATTTWSCSCLPTSTATVTIGHMVVISENNSVRIKKIKYKANGQIRIGNRANLVISN